jgi:hypothetical protein
VGGESGGACLIADSLVLVRIFNSPESKNTKTPNSKPEIKNTVNNTLQPKMKNKKINPIPTGLKKYNSKFPIRKEKIQNTQFPN